MSITAEDVKARLAAVIDPNTQKDFVSSKSVKNIRIDEGRHGPVNARQFQYLPNYSLYGVIEQWMEFDRI